MRPDNSGYTSLNELPSPEDYAILFEHGLLHISDQGKLKYSVCLTQAINYYHEHAFWNSREVAKNEYQILGLDLNELNILKQREYDTKTKSRVSPLLQRLSTDLNFWRLILVRLKREIKSIETVLKLKTSNIDSPLVNAVNPILKASNVPFSYISWMWYAPRLFYNLGNLAKHNKNSAGKYFDKKQFEIYNDAVWLSTGLTTCGISMKWWLTGTQALGPGGLYLTVALYLFDAINIYLKCNHEIVKLKKTQTKFNEATSIHKRIAGRINYLEHKKKVQVATASGLFIGMGIACAGTVLAHLPSAILATSIMAASGPLLLAGASVVLLACAYSWYNTHRVLPVSEINKATNPAVMLHHKLTVYLKQNIKKYDNNASGNINNKHEMFKSNLDKLDDLKEKIESTPDDASDDASKELIQIAKEIEKYAAQHRTTKNNFFPPKSSKQLDTILWAFKKSSWWKTNEVNEANEMENDNPNGAELN
jgi:hypothetical protein